MKPRSYGVIRYPWAVHSLRYQVCVFPAISAPSPAAPHIARQEHIQRTDRDVAIMQGR